MVVEKHVLDLIPAYALGCLDEGERALVVEHAADCALCQAEMRACQQVSIQLPLALTQTQPPKRVKEGLMRATMASERPAAGSQRVSRWTHLSDRLRASAPAWGLAGLAVIVILIASNLLLWQQVSRFNQGELPVIALHGTDGAPQAAGTIIMSRDGSHGALVVDGLPALDPGRQYQLWLIKDGERASGGVFSVKEDGYGVLYVKSTQPLANFNSFGVTIEPEGGSPGPTGEKVMGGG